MNSNLSGKLEYSFLVFNISHSYCVTVVALLFVISAEKVTFARFTKKNRKIALNAYNCRFFFVREAIKNGTVNTSRFW